MKNSNLSPQTIETIERAREGAGTDAGRPLLETRDLTKQFGAFQAISKASVSFEAAKIHAVLGENGAGKSTLMKLLFGLYQPTSGEILLDGKPIRWRDSMDAISHGLGMVQQHFSLVETLSAIDNIMLGAEVTGAFWRLSRKKAIAKIEALLPGPQLAVPWESPVSELTVGFRQRVELLKLLFREARILFLDEPTAVLTPQEVHDFFDVLRALRASGRTIVLITHKIGEVFDLCDTYTVLRQGKITARGDVAATTPDLLVEKMIGRRLSTLENEARPKPREEVVLRGRGVRETSAERGRMQGIDLDVRAGEIVGIAGIEGSGQSHFVDAVMGLRAFDGDLEVLGEKVRKHGTAELRARGVGLVPEDRLHQGLWPEESCYNNMIIGLEDGFIHSGVFKDERIHEETKAWADDFDVRASSLEQAAGSLSGGNQQKLIFAREVRGRKPRFLICHQPTRGVDLGAIEQIHARILKLRSEGLGVLLLSSELDELLALSDRIVVFYEGKSVERFRRGEFDRLKIGAAMTGVRS